MIIDRLSKKQIATQVFDLCTQIRSKTTKAAQDGMKINLISRDPVYLNDMSRARGRFYGFMSGECQAVETYNKKGGISSIIKVYSDGKYFVCDKSGLKSDRSVLKSAKAMLEDVIKAGEKNESAATITSYTPGTAEYTRMLEGFGVEPGYYDRAMAAYNKYMSRQGSNANPG